MNVKAEKERKERSDVVAKGEWERGGERNMNTGTGRERRRGGRRKRVIEPGVST